MGVLIQLDNIFLEMQMASQQADNSVMDARKDMNKIVEFFKSRDCYEEELSWFASETGRNLNIEVLRRADGFMVQDDISGYMLPEELQHDSLGFCHGMHIIYSGRFVYPVKDIQGDVMGWCGYDKYSDGAKYLDSINYGYKAKETTLYGMENLPEYYKSNEPVFIPEGIGCTLFLWQSNLCALAALGSHVTPYVAQIINRLGKRAIPICDSDPAGNKWLQQLHYQCPLARPIQSKIAKDIDDSRKIDMSIVDELRKLKNPFYRSHLYK
jgi:hypothetical protein